MDHVTWEEQWLTESGNSDRESNLRGEKWALVTPSCPTLCDPMDCKLPGSSVHGILQARLLEWVATSFYRGSSWPRDQTWVFRTAGRLFTAWATSEALYVNETSNKKNCLFETENLTVDNFPLVFIVDILLSSTWTILTLEINFMEE